MTTPYELHCPRCGKKLSERLNGEFGFLCRACKSYVSGETKPVGTSVVTAVTVTVAVAGSEPVPNPSGIPLVQPQKIPKGF